MAILLDELGNPLLDESSNPITDELSLISGTAAWGHVTGVLESNVRTFVNHWWGSGEIENSGDSERVSLGAGDYMVSEVITFSPNIVELLQNEYAVGDAVVLKYRTGSTELACVSNSWTSYTVPFASLGYVQIWIESTQ